MDMCLSMLYTSISLMLSAFSFSSMQPPTKNGSLKVQKKKDKESSKIVTEEDMSKLGGHSPNNSGDSGSESQSDSASVCYYLTMNSDT